MAYKVLMLVVGGVALGYALALLSGCSPAPFPYYIPPHGEIR